MDANSFMITDNTTMARSSLDGPLARTDTKAKSVGGLSGQPEITHVEHV